MLTIRHYLHVAREQNASHLYLHVGSRPTIKQNGDLYPLKDYPLLQKNDLDLLSKELNCTHRPCSSQVENDGILTIAIDDNCRARVTISEERKGLFVSCRLLPRKVPNFNSLGLPEILKETVSSDSGLILVIGRAASGKTTTLAGLIDYINHTSTKAVYTLEKPIEFTHTSRKSQISQIQLLNNTPEYDKNWKSALLKTADVLVIDGLQPEKIISPALSAASKGLLVLASVESNGGVAEVLHSMIYNGPFRERENRRQLMGRMLRVALWQHLFPLKNTAGMKPAVEILLNDHVISRFIRQKGHLHLLRPAMAAARHKGLQTMHQALLHLRKVSAIEETQLAAFEKDMLKYYISPIKHAF